MEQVIIDQNPHWTGAHYDHLMARRLIPELVQLLNLKEILVLSGVRRCGKTTLFQALINHLLEQTRAASILYINLDDPYFTEVNADAKNLYRIIEAAEKITKSKMEYLFLDEIQNVVAWEKFVKSVYDSKLFKKIFITGSNAHLLESDYATLLSGRYVKQSVHPLSFKEILSSHNLQSEFEIIKEKSKVLSLFDEMLQYGGFPACFLEPAAELKRKILSSYYETILFKDCIAANDIRDARLMGQLSHYLISNTAARYSYHKIAAFLGSNENTIKEYIHTLHKGFLVDELLNFSFSLQKQVRGNKKSYCIDNGFINAVAFQTQLMQGKVFENLVYNELIKRSPDEIYFLNDNKECDFIVRLRDQCIAIQVCHTLTFESRPREIEGAHLGQQKAHAKKSYIITYDQEETLENDMQIIPFWKCFGFTDNIEALF